MKAGKLDDSSFGARILLMKFRLKQNKNHHSKTKTSQNQPDELTEPFTDIPYFHSVVKEEAGLAG